MWKVHEWHDRGWQSVDLSSFRKRSRAGSKSRAPDVRCIVIGAGLSIAARQGSPGWLCLVKMAAEQIGATISSTDPNVAAYELSLNARATDDALANDVQKAIKKKIDEVASANGSASIELVANFARVVRLFQCDVILDLNYDDVVEELLDTAGIAYYRIVGSQVDVYAPLPYEGTVVLWKIHGSAKVPVTIVLSPAEYGRIYQTNQLARYLRELGANLSQVLTVGVGLDRDKVWEALITSDATELLALWQSSKWRAKEAEPALADWRQLVESNPCTVLTAPYRSDKHQCAPSLGNCLGQLADRMSSCASSISPAITSGPIKPSTERRWAEFDEQYHALVANGAVDVGRIGPLVNAYFRDYSNVVQSLQSWKRSDNGESFLGSRSLSTVIADRHDAPNGTEELKSGDLMAMLEQAQALHEIYWKPNEGLGYLVESAVQSVVRTVVELAHLLKSEDNKLYLIDKPVDSVIRRGDKILVGLNPFECPNFSYYTPFRIYEHEREDAELKHPFLGSPERAGNADIGLTSSTGSGSITPLMREKQWEAHVVRLYSASMPRLELCCVSMELEWAPPIYPWGFAMQDIVLFRQLKRGTVTRRWHMVEDLAYVGDSVTRKICKGGSLRDSKAESFMIGFRGLLRPGEFDASVEPVYA